MSGPPNQPPSKGSSPVPRKRKPNRPPTRIDWRDATVWVAIALLLAIGFGSAYALWYRTWQLDLAREYDWYVATSLVRLRDFRVRTEVFFRQQNPSSLAMMATSAARLDGALAQIPRRGPVQWRAEIIGATELLRSRLEDALAREVTAPDPEALAALAEHIPSLRDLIQDLEAALDEMVVREDRTARRLAPDFEPHLLSVIQSLRDAATGLPR